MVSLSTAVGFDAMHRTRARTHTPLLRGLEATAKKGCLLKPSSLEFPLIREKAEGDRMVWQAAFSCFLLQ